MVMDLGVSNGGLKACVKDSNCFHSDKVNEALIDEALLNEGLLVKIKEICLREGLKLQKEEGGYLYFTAESSLFGFVDDVEFFFDSGAKKVHFRSASRVGNSDLGVNEKRIRGLLNQL